MFHKGRSLFKRLPGAGEHCSRCLVLSSATLYHSSPLAVKVEQRGAREGEVASSC